MTRAKQHLTLLHARYRQIRGQLTRRVLSPFLVEIPSDTLTTVDETTGTRPEMFDRPLPGRRGPPPTRRTPSPTGGYSAPGPDRRTAAERDHTTGLAVSEMVRHPTYGLGRVTGFMTSGQSRFVRVRFNTVGEKMLDPTFAKLEKVSPA